MGILTQKERGQLISLIKQIPDYEDRDQRRWLKNGLPPEIRDQIEDEGSAAIHLNNILRAVDLDVNAPMENGRWPIITVIDNAVYWAGYYQSTPGIGKTISELKNLRERLQTRVVEQLPEIHLRLAEALTSAFPTLRKLELFLLFSLNDWMDYVARGPNLLEVALQLVTQAGCRGTLIELLDAAIRERPLDPYLRAVAVEAGRAGPVLPPYSPERFLDGPQIQQLGLCLAHAFIYSELRDLTWSVLGEKLEAISLRDDSVDVAIDLVVHCQRHGVLEELISLALELRPRDPALLWFVGRPAEGLARHPTVPEVQPRIDSGVAEALQHALVRAFTYAELRHLVVRTFGRELDVISLGRNLHHVAFDLLRWAEDNGMIGDLLSAARLARPLEPVFQSFPDAPRRTTGDVGQRTIPEARRWIDGDAVEAIRDAFLRAFDSDELRRLLVRTFGREPEDVRFDAPFIGVVSDVVRWAEDHGMMGHLLSAARLARPLEPVFQSVSDAPPADASEMIADREGRRQVSRREVIAIRDALEAAFSYTEIDQLVRRAYNETIEAITLADNLSAVVFELVRWADRREALARLVKAALSAKPDDAALRSCAAGLEVEYAGLRNTLTCDRAALVRTISGFDPGDMAVFLALIEGAAAHTSRNGMVRDQAADLVRWAESSTGPGLAAIQQALDDFLQAR